jgi:hypothetical protein
MERWREFQQLVSSVLWPIKGQNGVVNYGSLNRRALLRIGVTQPFRGVDLRSVLEPARDARYFVETGGSRAVFVD